MRVALRATHVHWPPAKLRASPLPMVTLASATAFVNAPPMEDVRAWGLRAAALFE